MAQQFVNSKLAPNKVVVFAKKTCPYCRKAIELLEELNLKPGHLEIVDLATQRDMAAIQDYLLEITGARTVPRVFIGEKCIGGFSELDALHRSGKLKPTLEKIGAL
ncbi:glutaredoxin-1 [Rhineura floridana]|uniref:glutaredoxin-1 n=1 Tax=Rhineura floridana TaxID=261503 RepID=UPI002AC8154C|nr:glutaredoxin-1 [Rhineura floridana]